MALVNSRAVRLVKDIEIRELVGQGKTQKQVVKMLMDEMGLVEADAISTFLGATELTADELSDVTEANPSS